MARRPREPRSAAVTPRTPDKTKSFAEAAKKWVGSLDGGPGALATNLLHMKRFGR